MTDKVKDYIDGALEDQNWLVEFMGRTAEDMLFSYGNDWVKYEKLVADYKAKEELGVYDNLTDEERKKLKQEIEEADPSNGYDLSWELTKNVMNQMNPTVMGLINEVESKIYDNIAEKIGNNDEVNSITEMLYNYYSQKSIACAEGLLDTWKRVLVDRHFDGTLSDAEMAEAKKLFGQQFSLALNGYNINKDGIIIDKDGNPITSNVWEKLESGAYHIDDNGNIVDEKGNPVDIEKAGIGADTLNAIDVYNQKREEEIRKKISQMNQMAKEKLAANIGDFAKSYSDKLFNKLDNEITKMEGKIGKWGANIAKGLINEIGNQFGVVLGDSVTAFVRSIFWPGTYGKIDVKSGKIGPAGFELDLSKIKINWGNVAQAAIEDAMGNTNMAKLLGMSVRAFLQLQNIQKHGGIVSGLVSYDRSLVAPMAYAEMYWAFGIQGGLEIPPVDYETATAITTTSGDRLAPVYPPTMFIPYGDGKVIYAPTIPGQIGSQFRAPTIWSSVPSPHIGGRIPYIYERESRSTALYTNAGWNIIGLPMNPILSDAAYILCEMDRNVVPDSYVQAALSATMMNVGAKYPVYHNLPAFLLWAEAEEFQAFRTEVSVRSGGTGLFKDLIKDKTDVAEAMYNRQDMYYLIGPFQVDYIRSYSHFPRQEGIDNINMADMYKEGGVLDKQKYAQELLTRLNPFSYSTAQFGMISAMRIYDQNGNEIPNGYWCLQWNDENKKDRPNLDKDYQFPYPKEDFYIQLLNYDGNSIQAISRIEIDYNDMVALAEYNRVVGKYILSKWHERYITWTTGHPPVRWTKQWLQSTTFMKQAQTLASVNFATKNYITTTQKIVLHPTSVHGGYETATFTTTSSTSISGFQPISMVFGEPYNSSTQESLTDYTEKMAEEIANGEKSIADVENVDPELAKIFAKDENGLYKSKEQVEKELNDYISKNANGDSKRIEKIFQDGNLVLERNRTGSSKIVKESDASKSLRNAENLLIAKQNIEDMWRQTNYRTQVIESDSKLMGYWNGITSLVNVWTDADNTTQLYDSVKILLTATGNQKYAQYVDLGKVLLSSDSSMFLKAGAMLSYFDKSGKSLQVISMLDTGNSILKSDATKNVKTRQLMSLAAKHFGDAQQQAAVDVINELLGGYELTKDEEAQILEIAQKRIDQNLSEEDKQKQIDQLLEKAESEKKRVAERKAILGIATLATSNSKAGNVIKAYADAYRQINTGNVFKYVGNTLKYLGYGQEQTAKESNARMIAHMLLNLSGLDNNIAGFLTDVAITKAYHGKDKNEDGTSKTDLEIYAGDVKRTLENAGVNAKDTDDIYEFAKKYVQEDDKVVTRAEKEQDINSINTRIDQMETIDVIKANNFIKGHGFVQNLLNRAGNEAVEKLNSEAKKTFKTELKKIIDKQIDELWEKKMSKYDTKHGTTYTEAIVAEEKQEETMEVYTEYSGEGKLAISQILDMVVNMTVDDMKNYNNQAAKAGSMAEIIEINNSYIARKSAKSPEEIEYTNRHFIDTVEPNVSKAVLFDSTPYTEYSPKFSIDNVDTPNQVYWVNNDRIGVTIGFAGCVWKDAHSGLENNYDGIRGANAQHQLEIGVEGVKVTLIDMKTGEVGKMWNKSGRKVDATTYTDEGGYYHIERVLVGEYNVDFEYDGQTYKSTTFLAGSNGDYVDYMLDPDKDIYDNDSKAIEDPNERQEFNDKFNEVINGCAIGKDGTRTPLEYEKVNGVSKLITLDNEKHVLPKFAMHARTNNYFLTYPINDNITLADHDMELTLQGNKYTFYSSGEYMYHINLGLVERSKADLALTADVMNATTTINHKEETYQYIQRGDLGLYDARLMETPTYRGFAYTRELYKADHEFRISDYQFNDLNKLDRNGDDKSVEINNIKSIKTKDDEEKLFVQYKITIKNEAILNCATVNELKNFYDDTYNLVKDDTYLEIQDSNGNQWPTMVAEQSYYVTSFGERDRIIWSDLSEHDADVQAGYKIQYTTSLKDLMLKAGEELYIYVTYEVDKDSNGGIMLGDKRNIFEISNYSTFEVGSPDKEIPEGLIDKDSEPTNTIPFITDDYEDDTDEAPVLTVKLYEDDEQNNGRTIGGIVWDDARDKVLGTGQRIGDGIRQVSEDVISGVRVQLIEKIDNPETGEEYEYVWKEMYTRPNPKINSSNKDTFKRVINGGNKDVILSGTNDNVKEEDVLDDEVLSKLGRGEYKFYNFVAGNYIVRFIYGDTPRTYLANETMNNDNDYLSGIGVNKDGEGENKVSYNGQDYKSTTYQQGQNIENFWYNLESTTQNYDHMSDAKDDATRRRKVIDYSRTIENDKAEVLASFDRRESKNEYDDQRNYYDETKHKELRDNTWMFADTARFNIEGEYNTIRSEGIEKLYYNIPNVDFGLEERPETRIELKKEITGIKITTSSNQVLVDTANGQNKNVNWVHIRKTEDDGFAYKRQTIKYTYKNKLTDASEKQGRVHIYMDEEEMQGTTIQIDFRITITNNSDIDYIGKTEGELPADEADPSLGVAYYQGRVDKNRDKIVTTKVDKIIDYVDNSLVFRKENSKDWELIEKIDDFKNGSDKYNTDATNYKDFRDQQVEIYGENYVRKHEDEFKKIFEDSKKPNSTVSLEDAKTRNLSVIQNMKKIGYLNPSLNIVQSKIGQSKIKENIKPITQVIVTENLKDNEGHLKPELKPGDTAYVDLTLLKTFSPDDKEDTLAYRNVAEIIQLTNTAGRRDMDAIPGNQDPDVRDSNPDDLVLPLEYDADVTEQIIITPPTGKNKAFYFVLATVVLVILATGIILIKKKVLDKK